MNSLESAVVVRHPKGFVAHLRFKNEKDDIDLSANNQKLIDVLVDRYIRRATR